MMTLTIANSSRSNPRIAGRIASLVTAACFVSAFAEEPRSEEAVRVVQAVPGDKAGPSRDAREASDVLLDDDLLSEQPRGAGLHGYFQSEAAYTVPKPGHWSKLADRLEITSQGSFSENVKWRVGLRGDYDAIYDLSHYYPSAVRQDQRFDLLVRETYLDIGAGNVELRIGRQQIVWGEVIGLFFADVVSAKDLRQFILPDFDQLRIPQWAVRAEYFAGDTHLEGIVIPIATVNEIGKPGSAFYAYPPAGPAGYGYFINDEQRPKHTGGNMNYGVRASTLISGWDLAGFAYRSVDASPTFFRQIVAAPVPTVVYTPRHERITQYGSTLAKDFGSFVLKAEAVFTEGQNFNTTRLNDSDGVVRQNYLDYIVSLERPFADDQRVNFQFFQRRFADHDPDIIPKKRESGVSLFWSGKIGPNVEPQLLAIHSLDRNDWMLRPKVYWSLRRNWRASVGADVFGGKPNGLFGQFDHQDRVYVELRRSF